MLATPRLTHKPVPGITNATQISGGEDHACVLLADGTVECWGENAIGELGDGTTTTSATPVRVAGITNATQISTGNGRSCALLKSGSLQCWGEGGNGDLGNGTATDSPIPVTVGPLVGDAGDGVGGDGTGGTTTNTPSVSHVATLGTAATAAIRCASSATVGCTFTLTLTATETLKRGKIVAITAAKRPTVTHRTIVLGTTTVTIKSGHTAIVHIRLNGAGRTLLAQRHRIRATLTLTHAGKRLNIPNKTVTFTTPKPGPRRGVQR